MNRRDVKKISGASTEKKHSESGVTAGHMAGSASLSLTESKDQSKPEINQAQLIKKMETFLTNLAEKEALPKTAYAGLCNGFSFMRARAQLMGKSNDYFERLEKLAGANDDEIKKWAGIYSTYQSRRRELIEEKRINPKDVDQQIIDELVVGGKIKNKEDFNYVKDLYFFIHSLLASHDAVASLRLNEAAQVNWDWMLSNFLTPDEKKSNIEVWSLGFVFKNQELIDTLEKAILEGDLVRMASSNHTMFLTKKNGLYELYDPNQRSRSDEIKIQSDDELVKKLKKYFFDDYGFDSKLMPIKIKIIQNNNPVVGNRPTADELIENILESRKINSSNINELNSISWDGCTALFMASMNGDSSIVKKLLENKADSNLADSSGVTPLYVAVQNNHIDTVKELLKHEANPDLYSGGFTPLYCASHCNNLMVVEELLKKGANPDLAEKTGGATPLIIAVQDGNLELVNLLLKYKANPTLADKEGFTPLGDAINKGHTEIIKVLIAAALNKNKENTTTLLMKSIMPNITSTEKSETAQPAVPPRPKRPAAKRYTVEINEKDKQDVTVLRERVAELKKCIGEYIEARSNKSQKANDFKKMIENFEPKISGLETTIKKLETATTVSEEKAKEGRDRFLDTVRMQTQVFEQLLSKERARSSDPGWRKLLADRLDSGEVAKKIFNEAREAPPPIPEWPEDLAKQDQAEKRQNNTGVRGG